MFRSPRMSLSVWNAASDVYLHEQLADNFLKLDIHDHSPGRGVQIGSNGIQLGAITSAHIFPGAIGTSAFADGLISTAKLADGAVTNAKLGAGAVTTDKLAQLPNAALTFVGTQTATATIPVRVQFNTSLWATGGATADITNHQCLAPIAGYYLACVQVAWASTGSAGYREVDVVSLTSIIARQHTQITTGSIQYQSAAGVVLLGVGDYVEAHMLTDVTSSLIGSNSSRLSLTLLTP